MMNYFYGIICEAFVLFLIIMASTEGTNSEVNIIESVKKIFKGDPITAGTRRDG